MFYYVIDDEGFIAETGDGPDNMVVPPNGILVTEGANLKRIRETDDKSIIRYNKEQKKFALDLTKKTKT